MENIAMPTTDTHRRPMRDIFASLMGFSRASRLNRRKPAEPDVLGSAKLRAMGL
jgi:hypothetical protein